MTVNQQIIDVVAPVVSECVPDIYTGESEEYCTFQISEFPAGFGDNTAQALRCSVMLHYFAPIGQNTTAKRRSLRRAIAAAFTAPIVTPAGDEISQHYVYEFEAFGEV